MNRELLKQALDTLILIEEVSVPYDEMQELIAALRAELGKPEPKPFAWGIEISGEPCDVYINKDACTLEFNRRQRDYPNQSRKLYPLYTKDQL